MLELDSDDIPKFDQPEKYRQYAKNVEPRHPDRACKGPHLGREASGKTRWRGVRRGARVPRGHVRLRVDVVQEARALAQGGVPTKSDQ